MSNIIRKETLQKQNEQLIRFALIKLLGKELSKTDVYRNIY